MVNRTRLIEYLVHDLQRRGVDIWVEGGRLRTSAVKGAITAELRAEIQTRKAELLTFLQQADKHVEHLSIQPIGERECIPLSFAQQRLWFLEQMANQSVYNMVLSLRLQGQLQIAALQQALTEIVYRHSSLRTTFVAVDGTPQQVIQPPDTVMLSLVDLRHLSPDVQTDEIARIAHEEAQLPMDLESDLLIRAKLLLFSPSGSAGADESKSDDHLLMLTMHHITFDGWSLGILLQELELLYTSFLEDRLLPLTELPIQYVDFAVWQREWLQGDALEKLLAYWRQKLKDVPQLLQLPTDRPRPSLQSYRGGRVQVNIDAAMTTALKELSQQTGTTLYMTLLAAFEILIYRYTQQEDFVIGTLIANRQHQELESLIGLFANTLALRADLSTSDKETLTFEVLLERVRQTAQDGYDHQDVPFERLVEEVQVERTLSHNPLVQVIFTLQNAPMGVVRLPGLETSHLAFNDIQNARFDLEFHFFEEDEQLKGFCNYSSDLFDEATIVRMMGHYQTLLADIVANPQRPIAELSLLTEQERHQLLVEWNDSATNYPKDRCIHQLFEEQVERTPNAIAVIFDTEEYSGNSATLTYGELNERANQLAYYLVEQGVGPETLVGICVEPSTEMIIGMLAILKSGGAYVPLDINYPEERLDFMLADTQAPIILTQQRFTHLFTQPQVQVTTLDTQWGKIARHSITNLNIERTVESPAYIIYTSGSTGIPKGVVIPHRAISRLLINTDYIDILPTDRIGQASNASFDAATFEIWGALVHGASLIGIPREVTLVPQDFASYVREKKITIQFLTTALFNQIVRAMPDAFATLRYLLFGGEAVDPTTVEIVCQQGAPTHLLHVYGPTESTTYSTWYSVQDVSTGARTIPIGGPLANTQIYVLDQLLEPVPINVAGELYIGGDGLAIGYHGRPELTSEKFIVNPHGPIDNPGRLYRTGDLARWLPDGNIEFLGRIDNQVKLRGFRIELGEIETVLNQHPDVQEAVLVLHTEKSGERRLVAYVVAAGQESTESLRTYLKQKLPDYMIPSIFVLLDVLPLTANGKIDRKALPAPDMHIQIHTSYVEPQTVLQEQLVEIWQQELHLDQIGIHDNFFDVGGHSLLLVKVLSRLKKITEKPLATVDLFRYPTIHALCEYLEPSPTDLPEPLPSTLRQRSTECQDIAIIGMAGRFPGADDIETFWENIANGVESVTFFTDEELLADGVTQEELEDPAYVKAGAILGDMKHFDANFFGFSAREAELLDPQTRLFLECAWQALEHADCDPYTYPGAIGVYAGSGENTYLENNLRLALDRNSWANFYQVRTANGKDFLATRVSYKLNLTGPAITMQTACSTSLVATHLACQSLLNGECDVALAGGVSVRTPNHVGYRYEEGMIFSPDGHCRSFDVQSGGTIGGNGLGIVALKRVQDALDDGDVIHAVIKGSAINNDGINKVGYTAPSVDGQIAAIRQALANADVDPATISYIETHGTGTKLGDPIELIALQEVFRSRLESNQTEAHKLVLGAVKTNFGHLDTAAGVTGLIKTALALKHGALPPTLHFTAPNPELNFPTELFHINTELMPWSANGTPRRAGVSSFGIGGTNAHAILEEAPNRIVDDNDLNMNKLERTHHLLTLSAKTDPALREMAARYAKFLAAVDVADNAPSLANICYTTHVGRAHFDHRLSIVGESPQQIQTKLLTYLDGDEGNGVSHGVLPKNSPTPKIAFLFTGQGAQYSGMGRILYETQPTFRATLDRCDVVLQDCLGRSLLELLYPEKITNLQGPDNISASTTVKDSHSLPPAALQACNNDLMESHPCGQAANFAIECALADLWRAWGIEPDFVLGHSLGDFAAAYTAGVLSLEDGLRLVTERGRLMERAVGRMVSVMASEAEVAPFLTDVDDVTLGVINGPQSVVISGAHASVERVVIELQEAGFKTRPLDIPVAAHSPMLDPVLDDFAHTVRGLTLSTPELPVVSSMTGQLVHDDLTDPNYWRQHLRNTVRFADGVQTLHEQGCNIFIEIGPKPTLLGMVEQVQEGRANGEPITLPSLRENQNDWQQMLDSLTRLYVHGAKVDWRGLDRDYGRHKVELPTYPFQRQRYWIDTPKKKQNNKPQESLRPLIDKMVHTRALGLTTFETSFTIDTLPFFADYHVFDTPVSPSVCQLAFVLDAAELTFGNVPCLLEDVHFSNPLMIPDNGERTVQLMFTANQATRPSTQPEAGDAMREFNLVSFDAHNKEPNVVSHVTGRLSTQQFESQMTLDIENLRNRCAEEVDIAELYGTDNNTDIYIGPTLRWLTHLWRGQDEALGRLTMPIGFNEPEDYRAHPGLLESCFAVATALRPDGTELELPSALHTVRFHQPLSGSVWWCYVHQSSETSCDIQILNHLGEVVVEILGIETSRAMSSAIQRQSEAWRKWLYAVEWHKLPESHTQQATAAILSDGALDQALIVDQAKPALTCTGREWLIFADELGAGEALAGRLRSHGDAVILVHAGVAYRQVDEHTFIIQPEQSEDYRQLVAALPNITDVIHCWSLDASTIKDVGDLEWSAYQSCGTTLHIVQALLHEFSTLPQLWLVTQGAQAVESQDAVTGFVQSALWGLGKTITLEHPELNCVCIDLDEITEPATQVNGLCAVVTTAEDHEKQENQIALRDGHYHVARLKRYEHVNSELPLNGDNFTRIYPIETEATYLITGGLGGLGLEIAHWLVEQGATQLVLMGRSEPTVDAQAKVEVMQAIGADVHVVQADVSNKTEVAEVLAGISDTYPLRGIIHAAGVLDDAALSGQTWAHFDKVFAPKVWGAWHLHNLTQEIALDFFVSFSSLAGVLGNQGQANHAAANAALDALAHYRCGLGLPALSINWAGWLGVGIAVKIQENFDVKALMAHRGLGGYGPQQGVQVFANLLNQPASQIGCMSIDWQRYLDDRTSMMPFYTALVTEVAAEKNVQMHLLQGKTAQSRTKESSSLYEQLVQMPPVERPIHLLKMLQIEVAHLLGLPSPEQVETQQGMIEMGLDSLMAIELRNRQQKALKIAIPVAKFLEGLTLVEITDFLLEELQTRQDAMTSFMDNSIEEKEDDLDNIATTLLQDTSVKMKEIVL